MLQLSSIQVGYSFFLLDIQSVRAITPNSSAIFMLFNEHRKEVDYE